MILFYDKRDGKVFATIDGRVHDKKSMECSIDNGIGKKNIGKYIIGWEETNQIEKIENIKKEVERFIPCGKDEKGKIIYKKIKQIKNIKKAIYKRIEHNIDNFKLLQKFEDTSKISPLDYMIKNGKVVKKSK